LGFEIRLTSHGIARFLIEKRKRKEERKKRQDRFSSNGAIKALSHSSNPRYSNLALTGEKIRNRVRAGCVAFGRDQGTAVQTSLCSRVHFQIASANVHDSARKRDLINARGQQSAKSRKRGEW